MNSPHGNWSRAHANRRRSSCAKSARGTADAPCALCSADLGNRHSWQKVAKNKNTNCANYQLLSMLLSPSLFKRRSLHLLARERITGLPTILRLPSTGIHCILLAFAWLDLTTPKMTNSHRFLAAGKQILFSFLSHHFSLGLSCLFNARYLLRQTCLDLRLFPDKWSCLRNVRNYHLLECLFNMYNIHI